MRRVAIIGAGLSGLVVARELRDHADVTVFEKSRGVGGRMATRYHGDFEFDHGAQFFTARSREFRKFLEPLIDEGVVANWTARFAEYSGSKITAERQWDDSYPHFVGTPRMNAIGKRLASDIDVHTETPVTRLSPVKSGWHLFSDDRSLGAFDWVVLTAPAPQTLSLAREAAELQAEAARAAMQPCFALMLGFDTPLDLPWQAALVRDADISWISVNSSKPGRNAPCTLVVHSTNAWAAAYLEQDAAKSQQHLMEVTSSVLNRDVSSARTAVLHRWRFANLESRGGPACYCDRQRKIAACGDWFVRGRVEAAFTSAQRLVQTLTNLD